MEKNYKQKTATIEECVDNTNQQPMHEPFDNRKVVTTNDGNFYRFILNPLDETYLVRPGPYVPPGMLPPEEYEIRTTISKINGCRKAIKSIPFFNRLLGSDDFKAIRGLLNKHQAELNALVKKSREHKAALRRFMSGFPKDSPAWNYLKLFS
ncbi:hypothetical protein [Methylomonas sp. AM2-LC]|uniref:hypothetical protein n=1 Tax=Methylomonas sp. AM2-LC TaxID=3153301 RepID=UPI003262F3AF